MAPPAAKAQESVLVVGTNAGVTEEAPAVQQSAVDLPPAAGDDGDRMKELAGMNLSAILEEETPTVVVDG